MSKYELALVVSAKLEEDARASVVDRAKDLISRFGGTVGEVEEWGRRRLAYEIQKQTEAYYYFIQFEAESSTPNEVEQRMRIMENVLRYLIVAKDENDTFKVTPETDVQTFDEDTAEVEADVAEAVAEVEADVAEAEADVAEAVAEVEADVAEAEAEVEADVAEAARESSEAVVEEVAGEAAEEVTEEITGETATE